jgi:hypothetical protein
LRVLNVPRGADTGGCGYRTLDAFRRHRPDWTYNLCVATRNYTMTPVDRPMSEALDLWRKADVIHHRNSFDQQAKLGAPDRPSVIHHHGSHYRALHESLVAEAARRRALAIVSTLDLQLIHPDDTEWLPTPYDLEWLAGFRQPTDDGVLRVAHAPTDRRIKSTQAFLAAVERLRGDGVNVEVVMIEKCSWAECLRLKGTADVYFDQVILGYGNNAVEAWGMGIPVIAGGADDTLAEMVRRFGSLPFIEANEGTIYDALVQAADPIERKVWAGRGLAHIRQWHDEKDVVDQLVDCYTRAVERW